MGARQPHHRAARADLSPGIAADREPAGGHGLQPLSGSRRQPRLRLSGLVEAEAPRAECLGDAYMSQDELPYNLGDALDLMDENAAMREVLGAEFIAVYQP